MLYRDEVQQSLFMNDVSCLLKTRSSQTLCYNTAYLLWIRYITLPLFYIVYSTSLRKPLRLHAEITHKTNKLLLLVLFFPLKYNTLLLLT